MKIARIIDKKNRRLWASVQSDQLMYRLDGDPLSSSFKDTGEVVEAVAWLPPIDPPAIFCIGLNYARHAAEGGFEIPTEPIVFMKNPAAAIGHEEAIRLPRVCEDEVDYECELVVIIGKTCRNLERNKALDVVLGYTAGNDVSARIWQSQRGGSQWVRGKSFDTFAPMGPIMVTPDELGNPNHLRIKTLLNGCVVQESNTSDMIFDVPDLLCFLSQDTTLLAGTVIMTGTPEGIGWAQNPRKLLHPGDVISIEIEKIGRLTNRVEG